MSNVRAKDRLTDQGLWGLLFRTVAAFALVCALLVMATQFLMSHIVLASIGEEAAATGAEFVEEIADMLPDLVAATEGRAVSRQQVAMLEGRMEAADIFELKLFDREGHVILLLEPENREIEVRPEGEVNATAVEVSRDGVVRHFVEEEGELGESGSRIYAETYVPAQVGPGAPHVFEAYVDVTQLATHLEGRLDFFAMFFVLGGLMAYSIPAVVLALRTRELRRRDMAVVRMSKRDGLTGLLNRGSAAERFANLLPRGPDDRVTLYYLDLDKFKSINDTMGHGAGDRMLAHIGHSLARFVDADADIAARFGGDEFVMLRRHPDGETDKTFAERVLAGVCEPLEILGQHVRPGISIGGYRLSPGDNFDDALRAADVALYEAKTHGRGRYVLHTPSLVARRDRRHAVEKRVREAIATEAFYLEYQPIYCDRVERLIGFEALLRLQADDASPISPVEFIPVAEAAGLIEELGRIALVEALRTASGWPEDVFVAVNVSALQLGSGRFPDLVGRALETSGVAAERLELELTESVFLTDDEGVDIEIADLKALGVKLALDDFGTGYSSLAYLWRLPFDKVKIDRAFLEGYEYDREKYQQFISTVVLLGRQMGMKVTAEGLETTDQLDMLERIGVQAYQGYLLGRPLPETIATDYAHRRPPPALMVLDELPPDVEAKGRAAG